MTWVWPKEVALIIPVYGAWDYAKRCVTSFLDTTPAEKIVYVVDDGNDDRPDHVFWDHKEHSGPNCAVISPRLDVRQGCTAGWNHGLWISLFSKHKYVICGNSDLVFTKHWYKPLKDALENGFDLVGPITNAPGHCPAQGLNRYGLEVRTDEQEELDKISLLCQYKLTVPPIEAHINGFCMMAKYETWLNNSFERANVFNPANKMTGNEDELQKRWCKANKKIGFVPQSFVFHYRSVSRPEALDKPESKGAIRPGEGVIR